MFYYIVSAADRLARDACMNTAIKLSRGLKLLGAKKTAAGLLADAYRRFPVGAHSDYGEKDQRLFGPKSEELISEFAAYLEERGRDYGLAPWHQPKEDALKALELMHERRIFDRFSLFVVTSPAWGSLLTLLIIWQALFFLLGGKEEAARVTTIVFFCGCIAAALFWRLREKFLAWMTICLFYAASRRLERESHPQRAAPEKTQPDK